MKYQDSDFYKDLFSRVLKPLFGSLEEDVIFWVQALKRYQLPLFLNRAGFKNPCGTPLSKIFWTTPRGDNPPQMIFRLQNRSFTLLRFSFCFKSRTRWLVLAVYFPSRSLNNDWRELYQNLPKCPECLDGPFSLLVCYYPHGVVRPLKVLYLNKVKIK